MSSYPSATSSSTAPTEPWTEASVVVPEVVAVVPARGGSKGLPRKNIRQLGGHPLIGYSVAAARAARRVSRTICSTDDAEIADAAKRYGAEVPFMRPAELASDLTPDLGVFDHLLQWLMTNEGWCPEILVQLRPTSPVRPSVLIDEAIDLLMSNPEATAVRTVCRAPCNPYKMWRLPDDDPTGQFMLPLIELAEVDEPYNQPRQHLPTAWWQTGTIDVVRSSAVLGGSMTGPNVLPLTIDAAYAIDIDSEVDFDRAATALQQLECVQPTSALDWARVRLLALDVDGTLTPGTMYYGAGGEELKRFHTHDGQGIERVRSAGVDVAIITRESSPIAPARARKLGITEVHSGAQEKEVVLAGICERSGIGLHEVAYVGDDIGDVPPMEAVAAAGGIPCAVADARPEVKSVALFQCGADGGKGAVRDVCDLIVRGKQAR